MEELSIVSPDFLSPDFDFTNSQAPYVRDLRNGQYRNAQGNIVPKSDQSGHIPLEKFLGYKP